MNPNVLACFSKREREAPDITAAGVDHDGQGRLQRLRTYRRLPYDDRQSAVGDCCESALLGVVTSQISYLPVHLI